jgi:hypothetical protein
LFLVAGATVRVATDFCLGDPRGEFCPEEAAELLTTEDCFSAEGEEEAESMANLVHRAHWKANPLEGFRSIGGLMQSMW